MSYHPGDKVAESQPLLDEENPSLNGQDTLGGVLVEPSIQVEKEILPLWVKLVYGFPSLPIGLIGNFYGTYVFVYYSDTVGLELNLLNVCYIILLFAVVLFFPFIGWVFDRTQTRWGRRRPWIAVCAPIFFTVGTLIWLCPTEFPSSISKSVSTTALKAGYFSIIYLSAIIFTFLVQTPYFAFGIELTRDFDERSSLFGYGQAFYVIGMVLSTGFPEFLLEWFPNTRWTFSTLAGVVGILGIISLETMCWTISERKSSAESPKQTPFIPGVRSILLFNKPFLHLLLVITLQNSTPYVLSLLPFWVQFSLGLNKIWSAVNLTVFIASGFAFIPFWSFISRKFGKRKAYGAAQLVGALGYLLFVLPGRGDKYLATAVSFVAGMSGCYLTYYNFLYQSIQGDVVDYDELKTGMRREALYGNIMQYFNWFMSVTSTSAPFLILAWLGFDGSLSEQSDVVNKGIAWCIAANGVAVFLGAIIIVFMYPITKHKYKDILAGIARHNMDCPALDPISNEIIQPLSIRSQAVPADAYWLFWTFFHSELKSVRRNVGVGPLIIGLSIKVGLLTALIAAMGTLWYFYQNYYILWGYVMIMAVTLLFYQLLCIRAAMELGKKLETTEIKLEMITAFIEMTSSKKKL